MKKFTLTVIIYNLLALPGVLLAGYYMSANVPAHFSSTMFFWASVYYLALMAGLGGAIIFARQGRPSGWPVFALNLLALFSLTYGLSLLTGSAEARAIQPAAGPASTHFFDNPLHIWLSVFIFTGPVVNLIHTYMITPKIRSFFRRLSKEIHC